MSCCSIHKFPVSHEPLCVSWALVPLSCFILSGCWAAVTPESLQGDYLVLLSVLNQLCGGSEAYIELLGKTCG